MMLRKSPAIECVTAWRIKLPLREPYHLSFGTVRCLDTIIVRVDGGGQAGWGESTPLPGYSLESGADVWSFIQKFPSRLPGLSCRKALQVCSNSKVPNFSRAALTVAVEEVAFMSGSSGIGRDFWRKTEGREVPIVGIASSRRVDDVVNAAIRAERCGYRTIKIKAAIPPLDVKRDIEICLAVRTVTDRKTRIRVDANQGYNFEQARLFLAGVQEAELQLLEQPLGTGQWKAMQRLRALSGNVKLMLDESIGSVSDLQKCISMKCADIVKFKLMKQGSLSGTLELADMARDAGLKVVIGNGVQSDLGCMQEARLQCIIDPDMAGEQNGFLKPRRGVLSGQTSVRNGKMLIRKLDVDESFLDDASDDRLAFKVG